MLMMPASSWPSSSKSSCTCRQICLRMLIDQLSIAQKTQRLGPCNLSESSSASFVNSGTPWRNRLSVTLSHRDCLTASGKQRHLKKLNQQLTPMNKTRTRKQNHPCTIKLPAFAHNLTRGKCAEQRVGSCDLAMSVSVSRSKPANVFFTTLTWRSKLNYR